MSLMDVALFVSGKVWEYDPSTITTMVESCGLEDTVRFLQKFQQRYGVNTEHLVEWAYESN